MSATQYASLVLRTPTPRKRALPARSFSAGRLETLVLAAGICLPVPLLAATGLSVPLPNVVERIAAALVPWAEPVALDATELQGSGGAIVPAPSDVATARPATTTSPAAEATAGPAPQQAARRAVLTPLRPGDRPAATPTRQPIATGSRPTPSPSPTPTGSAEPERTAETASASPTAAEPAPTGSPTAQAPAPAPAPVSEPAAAPAPAPAPTTTTATTSTPLQETVDTVSGVVADPVGTVEETIADPIGTVEETLPVLAPVTTPLKPLLPRLGGK
jgi:pyruvate dehydrogenase E2 component (dihydrolipoyllysine-residue acetyltransferase)